VTGELVEVKDLEDDADMSVFENQDTEKSFDEPVFDDLY
jgi:hypothetical protein